ncbi:hypothetical protein S7711_10843 [Stachybotrys chartarum IBT 7711]|uniref:Fungal N-terminal domain-containing protein n=1 Tax=Stachybotrys chartarum (strain CBS 109288 / IBT 7711) TaxID=1280523 RepID=A0A084B5M0_STACB|nr:hypothetical protein S7711_10843 [Stachybotrys chartarum IBT 7711]
MAEAFGIAAGIVGVISLSIQVIDKLAHSVANDESTEVAEFVADLKSSKTVLEAAQGLVTSTKPSFPNSQIQLTLSSLRLLIQDYSSELTHWSNHYDHLNALSGHKRHKQQLDKLFGKFSVAKRFIGSKSHSDRRVSIRKRAKFFETKLCLMVAVFGRELDLAQAKDLRFLNKRVISLSEEVSDEAMNIARNLEDLATSNASILSQSRSTGQRMYDVHSEISLLKLEMQEMKALITGSSSSTSSASDASISLEEKTLEHPLDNKSWQSLIPESHIPELHSSDSPLLPFSPPTLRSTLNVAPAPADSASSIREPSRSSKSEQDDDAKSVASEFHLAQDLAFETLFQATNLIATTSQEMFPPLVSEYFATLSAWQMMCRLVTALRVEGAGCVDRTSGLASTQVSAAAEKSEVAARRLISLRKMCYREGYESSVTAIEDSFNLGAETVRKWELSNKNLAGAGEVRLQDMLSSPLDSEATSQRSVRVNTWLFSMFDENAAYLDLHKTMVDNAVKKSLVTDSKAGEMLPADLITGFDSPETWKDLILKHWFIDGAGNYQGESFARSLTAKSVETNVTVKPIQMDDTRLETGWIGEPRFGAPREVALLVDDERNDGLETGIPHETMAPLRHEDVFHIDVQYITTDWLSDEGREKVEATSVHENTVPLPDEEISGFVAQPPVPSGWASIAQRLRIMTEVPSDESSAKQRQRARRDMENYSGKSGLSS